MSAIVTCPECRRALQVPDEFFGRTVRCPDCKHTFKAQPSAEVAAPVENTGVQTGPAPPPQPSAPPAPQEQVAEWDRQPAAPLPAPRRRPRRDEADEDDDDEDDDDRPRRRRVRRRVHDKSTLVLTLGIVGASLGLFGFCCNLFAIAGLGIGVTAWVMGQIELSAMRAGTVSNHNRSMVQTGWILGMVAVGLNVFWLLLSCVLIGANLSLNGGRF